MHPLVLCLSGALSVSHAGTGKEEREVYMVRGVGFEPTNPYGMRS